MKHRISLVIPLIFILVMCCSCIPDKGRQADNNSAPLNTGDTGKVSDYFPITPGSRWVYRGEGNEYASYTQEAIYTRDNMAQFGSNNGGTAMTSIFETDDDYVKRVYREGESYNPDNYLETGFTPNDDTILLKAPIKIGTSWTNSGIGREIVSVNSNVDTPAGSFDNCVKVKISFEDSTIYEYYHKNTGLIKSEFLAEDAAVTSVLEEFEIK